MATPHKHAELIMKWAEDTSQTVWCWDLFKGEWHPPLGPTPIWLETATYAVGDKPTQPPRKMCVIGDFEFPCPETEAPHHQAHYWFPSITDIVHSYRWVGDDYDIGKLEGGILHLSQEAAEHHARALLAANKQAISQAK